MRYTIEKHERYVIIEPLRDLIDAKAAHFLKAEFMLRNTSGQRNIVLDLSQVDNIDEDGVRMGLLAHRLCRSVGGLFIVTGLNSNIEQMFKTANLDNHFMIVSSVTEAEDIIFGNEIQREMLGGVGEQ